jgi:hypothetical protein
MFLCGASDCRETAVIQCDAKPGETPQQLRQRDPMFLEVLCAAKHVGNYRASAAIEIKELSSAAS